MELYLLRHGIAEEQAGSGRDPDRALTEEGRHKLRRVMKRAAVAGVSPSLIISSPYKRALETAEIAAEELDYKEKILRSGTLVPDSSPPSVWSEIREHSDEPALLLAGHEPLFSQTVAFLLGSTQEMIDFKKAALVRIDIHSFGAQPQGVLQWMLTPKLTG
jgi:phosphohistidine phosphatase